MKKLIAIFLATLSINAFAKENITLVYSWTAADKAANYYRALADEASKAQKKYNFIFEARPGAGGTVAANTVLSNPNTTIWLNGSAGFVRSNLFPTESQNMKDFRVIMPMCQAPVVIVSSKYRSWKDVPADAKLTIGNSGLGTTTHLVTLQLAKKYPNMVIVPFKSTSEALLGVLSGTVDFSAGFFGDSEQYLGTGNRQVTWLGQTGRVSHRGTELLMNQGFVRDLGDMNVVQQLFVSNQMSEQRFQELRQALLQAARTQAVKDAMNADTCLDNTQLPDSQLDTWFTTQFNQWRRLTQGVKVDK